MDDLDDSTQPSRGSMRRGSASDMKPAIANEINAMRRNIKQIHRGIIHPRTDKWIQYWDAVSFICLLFTACVTPVEVSLLESIPLVHLVLQPRHFALFITNRLVDSFFTVDLFLNFFIAYQEPALKGGMWVTARSKIMRQYLRTWFLIDLLSIIPFDILTRLSTGEDESPLSILRSFRFVRLFRLVKLLRILRASRILARWQNFIGMSFAQMTMIKFMTATFFLIHFMACTWSYVGLNWVPTPGVTLEWESTWLEHYGFASTTQLASLDTTTTNITSTADDEPEGRISAHRLYFISLYVAVCSMFGSVGSISPRNYPEYVVITIMMVIGSMVWAWVIGSLCGILATLNPHATAFQVIRH